MFGEAKEFLLYQSTCISLFYCLGHRDSYLRSEVENTDDTPRLLWRSAFSGITYTYFNVYLLTRYPKEIGRGNYWSPLNISTWMFYGCFGFLTLLFNDKKMV